MTNYYSREGVQPNLQTEVEQAGFGEERLVQIAEGSKQYVVLREEDIIVHTADHFNLVLYAKTASQRTCMCGQMDQLYNLKDGIPWKSENKINTSTYLAFSNVIVGT